MQTSLDIRSFNMLREAIHENMAEYIAELDNIDVTKNNALCLFAQARERYTTLEDVLFLIEDITKKLSE